MRTWLGPPSRAEPEAGGRLTLGGMLLRLVNAPRDYAWGSTVLLADLEGRRPTGRPEAEVWFGDHPSDPSDLVGGGTLDGVTEGSLPYLLKLLAADSPLSIQVHPTLSQAREGWDAELGLDQDDPERNYRDDNHKPELLVALGERFEALAGLRPVADTMRLLEGFGDAEAAVVLRERLSAGDAALAGVIEWLLSGEAADVVDGIIEALPDARTEGFDDALAAIRRIAETYPGDPGVIVAMLMNHLVLTHGEGIFLRAGLLHAYLQGLGVEIMAASDNVLRGGLTPKRVDVPELLRLLDATPGAVPVLRPAEDEAVTDYPVGVHDFGLRRVTLDGEELSIAIEGPSIVLATAGAVTVTGAGGQQHEVPVGKAVFASGEESPLTLAGAGEVFVAQPG